MQEHKVVIQDIIEMLGLGLGQATIISIAFGAFFVEGLASTVLSFLVQSIEHDLKFTVNWSTTTLCCNIYAGAVVGEVLCIFLASRGGLSSFIVSGYGILSVFLMLLSFTDDEGWFLACRFMVGFGLGLCQSAALALAHELVPERWRTGVIAMSFLAMVVGVLLGFALVLSGPHGYQLYFGTDGRNGFDQEWRMHLRFCAVPSVLFFLFSLFYVPDSPHMMARVGDEALARDVLKRIRRFNEMPFVTCTFDESPARHELAEAQSMIMSHAMFSLCVISATMSYLMMGMYSVVTTHVIDLTRESHSIFAPGTVLLIGNVVAAVILLLGTTCFALSNTKLSVMVATSVCCASCALFYILNHVKWAATQGFVLPLISFTSLLATSALVRTLVYKAAMDMQPLSCCVMGMAMVHAAGRLAEVFYSCIYGIGLTVQYPFFGPLAVICLFCVLLLQNTHIELWNLSARAAQLDSDIAAQQRLLIVANLKDQYATSGQEEQVMKIA